MSEATAAGPDRPSSDVFTVHVLLKVKSVLTFNHKRASNNPQIKNNAKNLKQLKYKGRIIRITVIINSSLLL